MDLLIEQHYSQHVLRMPVDEWPDPVNRGFAHINQDIYVKMQGPSELGMKGTLENWDRTERLHEIEVPTLVMAARHDTMDPAYMKNDVGAAAQRPLSRVHPTAATWRSLMTRTTI